MNNWWLAALEHFGLITREQAQHISNEIKNSIHKDNYVECFDELQAILGRNRVDSTSLLGKIEADVAELKAAKKPLAQTSKV